VDGPCSETDDSAKAPRNAEYSDCRDVISWHSSRDFSSKRLLPKGSVLMGREQKLAKRTMKDVELYLLP
jgi:hypothetical protein